MFIVNTDNSITLSTQTTITQRKPMATINERLRRVGDKTASIRRRMGNLEARVYVRLLGSDQWQEIPSWNIDNSGADSGGADSQGFIGEKFEYTYTVKINRDWLENNRNYVRRAVYGLMLRPVTCTVPQANVIRGKHHFVIGSQVVAMKGNYGLPTGLTHGGMYNVGSVGNDWFSLTVSCSQYSYPFIVGLLTPVTLIDVVTQDRDKHADLKIKEINILSS
jgi:hypothetical protein